MKPYSETTSLVDMLRKVANADKKDLPTVQEQVIKFLERNRYPRVVRTGPYVPRGQKAIEDTWYS